MGRTVLHKFKSVCDFYYYLVHKLFFFCAFALRPLFTLDGRADEGLDSPRRGYAKVRELLEMIV